jgi:hypothetical protein
MMTCGVLDGLTGPATDLVQLGWREAFRVSFDGGNGGQCGTEPNDSALWLGGGVASVTAQFSGAATVSASSGRCC